MGCSENFDPMQATAWFSEAKGRIAKYRGTPLSNVDLEMNLEGLKKHPKDSARIKFNYTILEDGRIVESSETTLWHLRKGILPTYEEIREDMIMEKTEQALKPGSNHYRKEFPRWEKIVNDLYNVTPSQLGNAIADLYSTHNETPFKVTVKGVFTKDISRKGGPFEKNLMVRYEMITKDKCVMRSIPLEEVCGKVKNGRAL